RDLRASALGGNSDIESSVGFCRRERFGKERVATVGTRRREDIHRGSIEERSDLRVCPPDRRCRRDYLGTDVFAVLLNRTQLIQCRFVEADQSSEGPRDQMKLILDDQIWR